MNNDDLLRKIIELAIQSAKALQKEETGYLHYNPHTPESAVSIPVYENMLFCLALLRAKTQESMQEAKCILDRLLYFQEQNPDGENPGNFPQYLHEFPYCRDHFLAIRLLCPLYWIKKNFSQVLGESLAKRVEVSFQKLLKFSKSLSLRMQLPLFARLAIGEIDEISQKETSQLMSPLFIGELLTAMQMRASETSDTSLTKNCHFWHFLETTWHSQLKMYVGPAVKLLQAGFEPACTLYDYYLGYFTGGLSTFALKPQIAALHAVLIQPTAKKLLDVASVQQDEWMVHKEHNFALSIQQGKDRDQAAGYYPLYFVTKEHTLVLDIPKGSLQKWNFDGKKVSVHEGAAERELDAAGADAKNNCAVSSHRFFTSNCSKADALAPSVLCGSAPREHLRRKAELLCELSDDISVENIEKAVALNFFVNSEPLTSLFVNEQKATTFSLSDSVQMIQNGIKIELSFQLVEGLGAFMGHIRRANRPSQILAKGKDRYTAYDWQVLLRPVRKCEKCKLRISFAISYV